MGLEVLSELLLHHSTRQEVSTFSGPLFFVWFFDLCFLPIIVQASLAYSYIFLTAVAAKDSSGPNPREFVEANFSNLTTSEVPQNEELSEDDLVPRHFMASSPKRSGTNKHATQAPAQQPMLSEFEQNFLAEQEVVDEAGADDIQYDDDQSVQEDNDQDVQDEVEQSDREGEDLDSSLESMVSIVSSIRRDDQASGDESEPEEILDNQGEASETDDDHGQTGEPDPPALSESEKVVEKPSSEENPNDAPPADFFIPEELRGELDIGQPNDLFARDVGVWKVPKLPWCQKAAIGKGWSFWIKSMSRLVTPSDKLLTEKTVHGKTLVALTEEGKRIPVLMETFEKLPDPEKPSIYEADERQWRKKTIMRFLATENSTCNAALGDWEVDSEKDGSISVGKLPLVLQELANGDRPARQVSPPPSFTFSGAPDSDAEGFHKAVYGDAGHLTDYLG